MEKPITPTPQPNDETEVIKAIKQKAQEEIERLKEEHAKEIARLQAQIETEHKHHIEVVREILTTGDISLVKKDEETEIKETDEINEEDEITQNLIKKYNLGEK